MDIEERYARIERQNQNLKIGPLYFTTSLVAITVLGILMLENPSWLGRLQEAIIVNWKGGGIIVAVGLFFIGGILGLWLMMRATSEIRELNMTLKKIESSVYSPQAIRAQEAAVQKAKQEAPQRAPQEAAQKF